MKPYLSELIVNVLLVLSSTLLLLFGAEILLRVVGYAGSDERMVPLYDFSLSEVPRSHWVFQTDFSADQVEIAGEQFSRSKPTDRFRLLFVGDSGTEGGGVAREERFAKHSAELLQNALLKASVPSTRLEAINAGVAGMSTVNEYLLFKGQLAALEPDVVVLGVFLANDINFNLVHHRYLDMPNKSWANRFFDYLEKRSALAHLFSQRLLILLQSYTKDPFWGPAKQHLWTNLRLIDEHGIALMSYTTGELAGYRNPLSSMMQDAYAVTEDYLEKFKESAAALNAKLLVVLIPTPKTVTERLDPGTRWPPEEPEEVPPWAEQFDLQQPRRKITEMCRKIDIACIDPTERFRMAEESPFLENDDHLSVTGHRILAEMIAERLLPELQ